MLKTEILLRSGIQGQIWILNVFVELRIEFQVRDLEFQKSSPKFENALFESPHRDEHVDTKIRPCLAKNRIPLRAQAPRAISGVYATLLSTQI